MYRFFGTRPSEHTEKCQDFIFNVYFQSPINISASNRLKANRATFHFVCSTLLIHDALKLCTLLLPFSLTRTNTHSYTHTGSSFRHGAWYCFCVFLAWSLSGDFRFYFTSQAITYHLEHIRQRFHSIQRVSVPSSFFLIFIFYWRRVNRWIKKNTMKAGMNRIIVKEKKRETDKKKHEQNSTEHLHLPTHLCFMLSSVIIQTTLRLTQKLKREQKKKTHNRNNNKTHTSHSQKA